MVMTKRQQAYVNRVESEALDALSFGPCPGCPDCLDVWGEDLDSDDFMPTLTGRVSRADLEYITFHRLPGLEQDPLCARTSEEIVAGIVAEVKADLAREKRFENACQSGDAYDEGSFSSSHCDICGCPLGGNRYIFHWIDSNGATCHGDSGCTDCLVLWGSGEVPDDQYLDWTGEPVDTSIYDEEIDNV